jgi:predicted HicB family RNase H-like nuclease
MTKNVTVRLPDELAAVAEALARVEGTSPNETVKQPLLEAWTAAGSVRSSRPG